MSRLNIVQPKGPFTNLQKANDNGVARGLVCVRGAVIQQTLASGASSCVAAKGLSERSDTTKQ